MFSVLLTKNYAAIIHSELEQKREKWSGRRAGKGKQQLICSGTRNDASRHMKCMELEGKEMGEEVKTRENGWGSISG
ncbi:hypothetical protein L596_027369 [Steinernema carpocapsae]|uniref:Uncharacterized protein n=1 Tax=Steinernema carpocapsae TaxID=34508 RepID=A0A4V5ZYG1_STECR|nr:hypothetical protein L596_027369 [Steinernema carpocapsae]